MLLSFHASTAHDPSVNAAIPKSPTGAAITRATVCLPPSAKKQALGSFIHRASGTGRQVPLGDLRGVVAQASQLLPPLNEKASVLPLGVSPLNRA